MEAQTPLAIRSAMLMAGALRQKIRATKNWLCRFCKSEKLRFSDLPMNHWAFKRLSGLQARLERHGMAIALWLKSLPLRRRFCGSRSQPEGVTTHGSYRAMNMPIRVLSRVKGVPEMKFQDEFRCMETMYINSAIALASQRNAAQEELKVTLSENSQLKANLVRLEAENSALHSSLREERGKLSRVLSTIDRERAVLQERNAIAERAQLLTARTLSQSIERYDRATKVAEGKSERSSGKTPQILRRSSGGFKASPFTSPASPQRPVTRSKILLTLKSSATPGYIPLF